MKTVKEVKQGFGKAGMSEREVENAIATIQSPLPQTAVIGNGLYSRARAARKTYLPENPWVRFA